MGLSHCLWRIYFILIWRWLCSTGSLWWFRLPLSFFFLVGCLLLCEKGKCEAIPYRRGWVNTVHLKLSQKTNICLCLCTDITVCRKICWVFTKDLHPQPHIQYVIKHDCSTSTLQSKCCSLNHCCGLAFSVLLNTYFWWYIMAHISKSYWKSHILLFPRSVLLLERPSPRVSTQIRYHHHGWTAWHVHGSERWHHV